jgi:hypothetical protein
MNASTHAIEQYKSLPATEALERNIAQQRIPQSYGQSRSLALQDALIKPPKKRPFDMADLYDATEPVEQAIAFPIIEWSLVDETDDVDIEPYEASSYVPSATFSSPFLGQRRRSSCRRLVRSKSLRSSLCALAGGSPCHSFIVGVEGSWGQFVCNEEEMISPISRSGQFVCNEQEMISPICRSGSDCGIYGQKDQSRSLRMPQYPCKAGGSE